MPVWGGVIAVSAYMDVIRGPGVLSSACDVLEASVMRGVGGMCGMCLSRGGVGGVGDKDWVWALTILEEHWESGICVCVLESGWAA